VLGLETELNCCEVRTVDGGGGGGDNDDDDDDDNKN
jgi:hypothetical protein